MATATRTTLSLGVRFASFYFFLAYAVWPLTVNFFPVGSLPSRFPLVVGALMIAVALKQGRPYAWIRKPAQLFIIFSFFYTASSVLGPVPPGLWEGVVNLVRIVGIGMALVLTIRSVPDLEFFLRVFVWYGVISSLYGLLFMIPGLNAVGGMLLSMGLPTGKDPNAMRMTGLLTDPTYFGLSIMPAFLITLHQVLSGVGKRGSKWRYWRSVAMTVILVLGLLLSFSRTTWAGVAAGVLVLTSLQGKVMRAVLAFLTITIFLQVAAPDELLEVALSANKDRATFEINERNDSRSGIWQAYFDLATVNPFGYGMGSIEYLRQLPTTFAGYGTWSNENPRPHNIYLFIWIEGGVQTLLPLMGLLWLSVARAWRIRNLVDPVSGIGYSQLAIALLSSMAIGMFGLGGMLHLFCIMIAIGLVIWYLGVEKKLVVAEAGGRR
ncbi:MAG: O-antigen ligase family protein [Magnetococcales bacterium]|nr:O-antigen ligase family protein [Magnetococcales bacterium]